MTPFRDAEGKRALNDIWEFCPDGPLNGAVKGMLVPYFERTFASVTETEQFTEDGEPFDYDPVRDGVDAEIGYDVWVCAVMLDAVLCGTDYTADCMGFSEMYGSVRKAIAKALAETKLFSKHPKYDVPGLRQRAAEALRWISGEICDSEVAEAYAARKTEFLSSVDALRARLLAG